MFRSVSTFLFFFVCATSRAQLIATLAGGGSNDGRLAAQTALGGPSSVAFDRAGTLYFAEFRLNRVRKVDPSTGVLITVAGSGMRGFAGDGGPALAASLDRPTGIAIDGLGNLYILDTANQRVRSVDAATQIIRTVAGGGPDGAGNDGIPATSAGLNPSDIALDAAGNLFIADYSRVRRVDPVTHIITTVAGTTSGFSGDGGPATAAMLSRVDAIRLDAGGNLYIADSSNQRVRRVDAATHVITTVAGTGVSGFGGDGSPATAALLSYPSDVAIDRAGNLFIADGDNLRIRRVDASTKVISTVAGSGTWGSSGDGGPAIEAQFGFSIRLTIDGAGNVHVADYSQGSIRRIDRFTNTITIEAGGWIEPVPATVAILLSPYSVAVGPSGTLFIADLRHHRIRRVTLATNAITTVAGTGVGGFSGDGGPATTAQIYTPYGVAVDAAGNLFIADDDNYRIRRVDAVTGTMTTVAGNGHTGFSGDGGPAVLAAIGETQGVAVDGQGNLYIVDENFRIRRVDTTTGIITTVAGGGTSSGIGDEGPATQARLFYPSGVIVDAAGNLFIADTGNNRIRKVDATTRIISTVAGGGSPSSLGDGGPATSASLSLPTAIALDAAGNLFIADRNNHRIRRVSAGTKLISTIAGSGSKGFAGDGGLATAALLDTPCGVAVDPSGNLYIADMGNDRIRVVIAQPGPGRRRGVLPP